MGGDAADGPSDCPPADGLDADGGDDEQATVNRRQTSKPNRTRAAIDIHLTWRYLHDNSAYGFYDAEDRDEGSVQHD